jgi:hypothetical protein
VAVLQLLVLFPLELLVLEATETLEWLEVAMVLEVLAVELAVLAEHSVAVTAQTLADQVEAIPSQVAR